MMEQVTHFSITAIASLLPIKVHQVGISLQTALSHNILPSQQVQFNFFSAQKLFIGRVSFKARIVGDDIINTSLQDKCTSMVHSRESNVLFFHKSIYKQLLLHDIAIATLDKDKNDTEFSQELFRSDVCQSELPTPRVKDKPDMQLGDSTIDNSACQNTSESGNVQGGHTCVPPPAAGSTVPHLLWTRLKENFPTIMSQLEHLTTCIEALLYDPQICTKYEERALLMTGEHGIGKSYYMQAISSLFSDSSTKMKVSQTHRTTRVVQIQPRILWGHHEGHAEHSLVQKLGEINSFLSDGFHVLILIDDLHVITPTEADIITKIGPSFSDDILPQNEYSSRLIAAFNAFLRKLHQISQRIHKQHVCNQSNKDTKGNFVIVASALSEDAIAPRILQSPLWLLPAMWTNSTAYGSQFAFCWLRRLNSTQQNEMVQSVLSQFVSTQTPLNQDVSALNALCNQLDRTTMKDSSHKDSEQTSPYATSISNTKKDCQVSFDNVFQMHEKSIPFSNDTLRAKLPQLIQYCKTQLRQKYQLKHCLPSDVLSACIETIQTALKHPSNLPTFQSNNVHSGVMNGTKHNAHPTTLGIHQLVPPENAIAGFQTQFNKLWNAFTLPIAFASKFKQHNVHFPRGAILTGPTGCGKTFLAERLLSHLEQSQLANTLIVNCTEIISKYVGGTESGIARVFEMARGQAPCIVLLENLHVLAPPRLNQKKEYDRANSLWDRSLSVLLTELDGVGMKSAMADIHSFVYLIGTAPSTQLIDAALLRPGRLDMHIELLLPDQDTRTELIHNQLKHISIKHVCHSKNTNASVSAVSKSSLKNVPGSCRSAESDLAVTSTSSNSTVSHTEHSAVVHKSTEHPAVTHESTEKTTQSAQEHLVANLVKQTNGWTCADIVDAIEQAKWIKLRQIMTAESNNSSSATDASYRYSLTPTELLEAFNYKMQT